MNEYEQIKWNGKLKLELDCGFLKPHTNKKNKISCFIGDLTTHWSWEVRKLANPSDNSAELGPISVSQMN